MQLMKTKKKPGPKKGVSYKNLERPYDFGKRLYEIRKRKNLTQQQLADQMEVSVRVIKYLEREAKNPTLENIKKLSKALGVSQKTFFDDKAIESIEETPHSQVIRPLKSAIPELSKLPRKDQKSIVDIINTFVAKNKLAH